MVVLLVIVYASVDAGGPSGAAVPSFEPVYNVDFPDPSVMVYNGREYAYSTNSNFVNAPWATSTDSTQWTAGPSDALPTLPPWSSPGDTWAPSVEPNAAGQFVMWYTVADRATGTQCISRAVSSSPSGPFTDANAGPAIYQASVGSIDPDIFTDPNTGQSYLYWKSDGNSVGEPSLLWGEPLDANLNLSGSPTVMLRADQTWQQNIIEAPTTSSTARTPSSRTLTQSGTPPAPARSVRARTVCSTRSSRAAPAWPVPAGRPCSTT